MVGLRQFSHGKLLINDLRIRAGEHVLDVGTGTGLLAAHVAALVGPQGRVVAIDPLPLRIELAKKKAPPQLEARVGNAEDLSAFSPNSFDVVYLNSVIHWISDKQHVLEEIRRCSSPGDVSASRPPLRTRPHDVELIRTLVLKRTGLAERAAGIRRHSVQGEQRRGAQTVSTSWIRRQAGRDPHDRRLPSERGRLARSQPLELVWQ